MKLRVGIAILAGLVVPFVTTAAVSVSMPVPADVQAALFKNIWKLDRNFDCTKGVRLAIVYQEKYSDSVAAKDEFLASISRLGPHTIVVLIEAGTQRLLGDALRGGALDMIYVTPLRAVDVSEIGRISRFYRIRTITGVPEYVEAGLAVGIGIRKDRPLIIINLAQARAEGAAFSSQLLSLARIVGPVE
jgi:hypothetical protein